MVLAFYDIETTGFSREHNDIIEISAVAWDSVTEQELDTFTTYINPMGPIPAQITELTGISAAKVAGAPRYWEIVPQFFAWLKNWGVERMCGYNSDVFDWPFINAQIDRYKLRDKFKFDDVPQLDLIKVVREMEKKGQLALKDFCKNEMGLSKLSVKQTIVAAYFGITYDAHDSLNDCRALKDIYLHLRNINFNLM